MGEGNIFTLCASPHLDRGEGFLVRSGWWWKGGDGYPIPGLRWGVPHLRSGVGGTPVRSGWWGVPHPRSGWWGLPLPGLDGGGGTQVNTQARSGWWGHNPPWPGVDCGEGYLIPGLGWGVPWPGLDSGGIQGTPQPGLNGGRGTQGTSWPGLDGGEYPGYPPGQVWMVGGTWGTPPLDRAA